MKLLKQDDLKDNSIILKIWDLSDWKKSLPSCKYSNNLSFSKKNFVSPPSAVAINQSHSIIAVGKNLIIFLK